MVPLYNESCFSACSNENTPCFIHVATWIATAKCRLSLKDGNPWLKKILKVATPRIENLVKLVCLDFSSSSFVICLHLRQS